MSSTQASPMDGHQPGVYVIRIRGHLSERWAHWFEGLSISLEEHGDTLVTGPVVDQAALHGLLRKVRDLGLPLISVNRLETGPSVALGIGRADAAEIPVSSDKESRHNSGEGGK